MKILRQKEFVSSFELLTGKGAAKNFDYFNQGGGVNKLRKKHYILIKDARRKGKTELSHNLGNRLQRELKDYIVAV